MVSIMPNINLHNLDCMEFLKGVPDKYYDLAIVDPPYGIGDFRNRGVGKGELGIGLIKLNGMK
jgi:site-specific DNA-methyltransferase (adenine-specific)